LFDVYFYRQRQQSSLVEDSVVSESEITQYIHILLCKDALTMDQFQVQKEGQIGVFFLHALAGEFKRRGGDRRAWL
jgi:hypothetical protein